MKIFTFTKGLMVLFMTASIGLAQIIVEETFDYEQGAILDSLGGAENGWGGPWETFSEGGGFKADKVIVPPSDYPGLRLSGNRLAGTVMYDHGGGLRSYRPLAEAIVDSTELDLWLSFLIEIENSAEITQNNSWQGVSFWADSEQAYFGKNWGSEFWGIIPSSAGGSLDHHSTIDYTMGEAWLVLLILMSGGAGNEQAFMWVSPDPSTEPSIDTADVSCDVNFDKGITHIACHLGQVGYEELITTYFDEIRLGYSFDDVSVIGTSVDQPNSELPSQFELFQNYPNPFNPTTTIAYALGVNGRVKLSVYDLIGREIAVLVDGKMPAGNHEVEFSGENLSSGLYFYKLQTADRVITRKMMLIK